MRFTPDTIPLLLSHAVVCFTVAQCNMFHDAIDTVTLDAIINNKDIIIQDPVIGDPTDPVEPPMNVNGILFASYPFDGNADDVTGNGHDGMVSGAVLTEDRNGNPNSAYLFDGTDDYIIAENMETFPAGNTPRTICGWFKSLKKDPYIMMLFGFGFTEDGYNFQVGIGPNYENGETEFRVNGWGDDYDWRTGVLASEFLDGKWHHCAVTYDGTTTRAYFDGVLRNSTTTYRYISDPKRMHLVIGREIDIDEWEFEGALDDIRVYTKALSQAEIAEMVAPPPPPAKLFAYYPFNGNAHDETGNGHDATVNGADLTADRFGRDSRAYEFDGEDDHIICRNVSDFPAGNTPRSITGWFKSTNSDPYIMMLFGLGSMRNRYNFQVGIGPGNEGTQYRVNGWGDSFDWRTGVKAPEFLDGRWHHCTVTYDGTITKVYFDGVLRNQTSQFDYIADPETMVLVIGREIDLSGWEWQGTLDDVAVYCGVLRADEIAKMAQDIYR